MSIPFTPDGLSFAVIEFLAISHQINTPVDYQPEREEQYRIVCLAAHSEDAWRIAHLLRVMHQGLHTYSVSVAEPSASEEHSQMCCESCGVPVAVADSS